VSIRPTQITSLDALAAHCWQRLARALEQRSDPWRTPAIATLSGTEAALRTVVLRAVNTESRELMLHTDARSAKAGELLATPRLAWLFWDSDSKEQLRCSGTTSLHVEDTVAEAHWHDLPTTSRANYRQSSAPGTPVGGRSSLPLARDDDQAAFSRFLVVRCQLETMDWLQLHPEGHRRARLTWSAPRWRASWVAP
jgi:pyridoxine/pyridoxamine 5'-phosphate oxidase